MIGNNELRLNEATVMEAIQEWLRKRMINDVPIVKAVRRGVSDNVFIVDLSGPEPKTGGAE